MDIKTRIGAAIKAARLVRGLSQRELAAKLGYEHYQRVLLWESGRTLPTLEAFEKMETVLDLKLDLIPTAVKQLP